jgi:Ca2+-binding RTX toxin-like protein
MNSALSTRKGAPGVAVVLFAVLTALAVLLAAKPSQAQDVDVITINPGSIDFGSVTVGTDPATQQVTVTNNGLVAITIGDVDILGTGSDAFALETVLGLNGLTIDAGESEVLDLSFDPLTTGLQTAQLTLTDLAGNTIAGVPTIDLTGQGVGTNPPGSGCTITGSDNSETLRGTAGKDVICGLGGNDKINGRGGNDVLRGGAGKDRITDKRGKDRLLGQGGRDTLNARDGNRGDLLKGGGGKDRAIKDKRDRARSI